MKSRLSSMESNAGFIFPAVLFYITVILLLLLTGIQLYEAEQQITHNFTGQLQNETLLQMNKQELTEIYRQTRPDETVIKQLYQYPHGEVDVILREVTDTVYKAEQHITSEGGVYQLYSSMIPVPPPPKPDETNTADIPDSGKDTSEDSSPQAPDQAVTEQADEPLQP